MKKKNKYWSEYKLKYKNHWHFDSLKKNTKDFFYIGNIQTDYAKILKKISIIEKNKKFSTVVSPDKKLKKIKQHNRIDSFLEWGYKKEQTEYLQIFSDEYPKLFEKFIKISKLDNATSSLIKQYPGNTIPWHYDTHVTLKNKIRENKTLKDKKIIRYMVFLTDWDWGHYFCVGNNVVHQWRAGDIITWNPIVHHCGSNAGMTPKITLNITGLINSNSIHLLNKKNFIIK